MPRPSGCALFTAGELNLHRTRTSASASKRNISMEFDTRMARKGKKRITHPTAVSRLLCPVESQSHGDPGPSETHACPFKHYSQADLTESLQKQVMFVSFAGDIW